VSTVIEQSLLQTLPTPFKESTIMNNRRILSIVSASLIGLAAFGAQAQEINRTGEYPYATNVTPSAVSAAQVRQELMQAKASGQMGDSELYGLLPMNTDSTVSYEQTRADLAKWRADGYYFNDATYPVPGRTARKG
jgi:hypothetical protein